MPPNSLNRYRVAPYCVGCNAHHSRRCEQQQRINRVKTAIAVGLFMVTSALLGAAAVATQAQAVALDCRSTVGEVCQ